MASDQTQGIRKVTGGSRRPGAESRGAARPRAKRPAVLLDERDRRALATPRKPQKSSSNLGLWLTMIPLIILLLLSLVFNYYLYRNQRDMAAENLKISREFTHLQEEVQSGLSRIDSQQNEIEQLKQAVKTLKDWLTEQD